MKKPDRRDRSEILQHERWDSMIGDPALEAITVPQLRILDNFLAFFEATTARYETTMSKQLFLVFDKGYAAPARLRLLKHGINTVYPGHPDTLALTAAIREKERAYDARNSVPKPRVRTLSKSVPEEHLPPALRDAIADMRAGFCRNNMKPPAEGMLSTHVMKLRQLIWSARKANLSEEISPETVRAYARDLRERDLSPVTLRASLSAIDKIARYVSTTPKTLSLLSALLRIYERKAAKAPKTKYQKLQNTGYSPVALINRATALLETAPALISPRDQHAQRNRATALALFSVMPVRLADTRLVFGETLLWTENGYTIETCLSKTNKAWSTDVDPRLNLFIDAVILRGCDPAWLTMMRNDCLERRRALFITGDGTPVGYNYVSDQWRQEVGTGEHIARTILHTFLGIERGLAGVDMAKASCGQTSVGIEKEYQSNALAKAQRLKGQAELTAIAEESDSACFQFT